MILMHPMKMGRMILLFLKVIPYFKSTLDLGIDLNQIKMKFFSILTQRGIKQTASYDDMTGPLIVCITFGLILMMVTFQLNQFRKAKFSLGTSMDLVYQVRLEYSLS